MQKLDHQQRIHVYLARIGLGSRRELERLIESGKVRVNGRLAELGQKIDPKQDEISIRGKVVSRKLYQASLVYVFHKPKGVVTTLRDPEGRPTVVDFLPRKIRKKIFPVGRLDLNSEGLLLLTNDGDLAYQLTHPSFEIPKVYEVKIRGVFTEKKRKHLEKGVLIGNQKYKPAEIIDVREVTKSGINKFIIKIRVFEGKNHHVRKLFEALACRVVRLKRLSIGKLSLRGIPLGEYRQLTENQIERLKSDIQSIQQQSSKVA